jgi:hypothetical protein
LLSEKQEGGQRQKVKFKNSKTFKNNFVENITFEGHNIKNVVLLFWSKRKVRITQFTLFKKATNLPMK